jgi:protein SCO1/2
MTIEMLRRIRYAAIAVAVVAGAALLAAEAGLFRAKAPDPAFGGPSLGAFTLVDQNGETVGRGDLIGRPVALFFGFTHCPDVCPTTLASMTALLGRLGSDAERLGVYFVTVDPDRDTTDVIKTYLSSFDPRIRGLTGTKEQIATFAKPLGVYFARAGDGDGYTVDHTSSVFLLDKEGRFRATIAYGEDSDVALAKLRDLVR